MNRIDSIWHQAEVHSIGNISSTSTAIYGPSGASTDLDVSAQEGSIEERVESYWDYRNGLPIHGHPIVQTFTNGSMGIRSHLNDDTRLQGDMSDADLLRESLESVDLIGEIARRELPINKTIISVEGREIPYVDYGPLGRERMENLLSNTSPERETTPEFLQVSMGQLGLTDAGSIGKSSSSGTGKGASLIDEFFDLPESEQEKLKTKQSSIEALPATGSICFVNSSNASNSASISPLDENDPNWIDPDETIEPEDEIGVDPSVFASTNMPGGDTIMEDEDTVFVINTMWPKLEELYPLNKTRNAFRLGGPQQRLGGAFVGRKVRTDDYFTEWKLPLNKDASKRANATRSIVLTDPGRL